MNVVIECRCRKCGHEFGIDLTAMHAQEDMRVLNHSHTAVHEGCPETPPGRVAYADIVTIPEGYLWVTIPNAVVPVPGSET